MLFPTSELIHPATTTIFPLWNHNYLFLLTILLPVVRGGPEMILEGSVSTGLNRGMNLFSCLSEKSTLIHM